jgi:hypothetical protein
MLDTAPVLDLDVAIETRPVVNDVVDDDIAAFYAAANKAEIKDFEDSDDEEWE